MAANIDFLVDIANSYIKLHSYPDYGPMGLQFRGKEKVQTIAASVSVSQDIIESAHDRNADLLLVHHGLFWNNEPRSLEYDRYRIGLLKKYDISLLAYHLALDGHPKLGNNYLAAKKMGLTRIRPWGDIGYSGSYKKPMEPNDFFSKVVERFSEYELPTPEPIDFLTYGKTKVENVAVITGGAPQYITQAFQDGFDTFVTGEIAEPTLYIAQDLGMNFLSLGHYKTETLGVRALMHRISDLHGLDSWFITPNI